MSSTTLTKFSLADLRAAWGPTPAAKPRKVRGRRKYPIADFGPGNCNLLDVQDRPEGPDYRKHVSREVVRLHALFRARGQRVRICKRRCRDADRFGGRPFFRIVVVVRTA